MSEKILADTERKKAQDSEKQALESLHKAYLSQARAGRFSGLAGRRFDGLEALKKAADLRPSLDVRNETIACMALVDAKIVRQFDGKSAGTPGLALDSRLERFARCDRVGNISIRQITDDKELFSLPGAGVHCAAIDFSPDDHFLAVKYHNDERRYFSVWDLRNRKEVLNAPRGIPAAAKAFSKDSRWLAYAPVKEPIKIVDLTGKDVPKTLTAGPTPERLAFSPDGSKLAVSIAGQGSVVVREVSTGKVLKTFNHPERAHGLDWSPDGRLLAVACANRSIYLWNYHTPARPHAILTGHLDLVSHARFNQAGDLLVSHGWDVTTRLWDPFTGRHLLTVPGTFSRFSQDDSQLAVRNASQVVIWQLEHARECRTLFAPGNKAHASISPDGRLLASPGLEGVRIWDLGTWKVLADHDIGDSREALFTPDGRSLITCGARGVQRWPLHATLANGEHELRLGPPEPIAALAKLAVDQGAHLSPDGMTLGIVPTAGSAIIFDLENLRQKFVIDGHHRLGSLAFSSDGKWIASGTWQGKDIKLWNAKTGEHVHTLPTPWTADVRFSPDSKWLLTCTADEFRLLEAGSWREGDRLARAASGGFPGTATYSKNDAVLAVMRSREAVRLYQTAGNKELATLEFPDARQRYVQSLSPDGSLLVTADNVNVLQVWDLRRIRSQLKALDRDWQD